MIDVYDDVLEEHNAILVDEEVKQIYWKYDYHSAADKPNKHWHVFCGHNKEECDDADFGWAHQIFSIALNARSISLFLSLTSLLNSPSLMHKRSKFIKCCNE